MRQRQHLASRTETEPFSHCGEFLKHRLVSVWPRQFKRPHPPVYLVVAGSPKTVADTVEPCAEAAGTSRIIFEVHRDDLPHWKVVRTLTGLAEQVISEIKRRRDAAAIAPPVAAE